MAATEVAVTALAGRSAADDQVAAGPRSPQVDGGLTWLLGLGLLIAGIGGWVWLNWRRQRQQDSRSADRDLLPPPSWRPSTPHERLHDPNYLRMMLKAESDSQSKPNDPSEKT